MQDFPVMIVQYYKLNFVSALIYHCPVPIFVFTFKWHVSVGSFCITLFDFQCKLFSCVKSKIVG